FTAGGRPGRRSSRYTWRSRASASRWPRPERSPPGRAPGPCTDPTRTRRSLGETDRTPLARAGYARAQPPRGAGSAPPPSPRRRLPSARTTTVRTAADGLLPDHCQTIDRLLTDLGLQLAEPVGQ